MHFRLLLQKKLDFIEKLCYNDKKLFSYQKGRFSKMAVKNINSSGILISPKSMPEIGFQEYMYSYSLKEIQQH